MAAILDSPHLGLDQLRIQAVERIITSRSFNKSPRLSSFLQYVCTRAIEGRVDEISEQQIGVAVFAKPADYNPGTDNIVRGAARQLRQRLALYYQEEGVHDSVRITLPRGGYVSHFEMPHLDMVEAPADPTGEPALDSIPEPLAEPDPLPISVSPVSSFFASQYRGILAGVLLSAALTVLVFAVQRTVKSASLPLTDRFWTELLPLNGKTFLVPCDSGVVMLQQVTKRTVGLPDYSNSGFSFDAQVPPNDSFRVKRFDIRKYTTIADLKLAARIVRLPQVNDHNVEIRFGRDLRVEDLQHTNAILVGGPQGNPWISLFDHKANFRIDTDDYRNIQTVVNLNPKLGERPTYTVDHSDRKTAIYSIVSFGPNLDRTGQVLAISGTSMAGLDAANEFFFRSGQFESILREALKPDGTFRSFELLLVADTVSLNALSPRIPVSARVEGKRISDD